MPATLSACPSFASHCATTNSPSPPTASAMVILFDAYSVMVGAWLLGRQWGTARGAAAPDLRSSYIHRSESFVSARIEASISRQFDLRSDAKNPFSTASTGYRHRLPRLRFVRD